MDPASLVGDLDPAKLLVMCIAGGFSLGYVFYGKKQQRVVALLSGVGLGIYPWFVDSLGWSIAVGVVLIALPFLIRA